MDKHRVLLVSLWAVTLTTACAPVAHSGEGGDNAPKLVPFQEEGRGGKWGYKDGGGKVVIQPTYDDARSFSCGLAAVNMGAKWCPFGPFKEGGQWGYIDATGAVVVPLTLRSTHEFSEGLAHVWDEKGQRFIDTKGKTVLVMGEGRNAGDFSEGLAPVHLDRSLQDGDWQTEYIDKQGQTVLTVQGYAEEFHDGMARFSVHNPKDKDARLCGFICREGTVVVPPVFAEVSDFSDGLAAVRPKKTGGVYGMGDTWGYIDKRGKYVIEPQFNEAHRFIGGVARAHSGGELYGPLHARPSWKGGEWLLLDKQGKVLKRSNEWLKYSDAPTPIPETGGK